MLSANATPALDIAARAARVRADFEARGVNLTQWARERNFNPDLVLTVLKGTRACKRGQSYQIALALGIKDQPRTTGAQAADQLEGFVR